MVRSLADRTFQLRYGGGLRPRRGNVVIRRCGLHGADRPAGASLREDQAGHQADHEQEAQRKRSGGLPRAEAPGDVGVEFARAAARRDFARQVHASGRFRS